MLTTPTTTPLQAHITPANRTASPLLLALRRPRPWLHTAQRPQFFCGIWGGQGLELGAALGCRQQALKFNFFGKEQTKKKDEIQPEEAWQQGGPESGQARLLVRAASKDGRTQEGRRWGRVGDMGSKEGGGSVHPAPPASLSLADRATRGQERK